MKTIDKKVIIQPHGTRSFEKHVNCLILDDQSDYDLAENQKRREEFFFQELDRYSDEEILDGISIEGYFWHRGDVRHLMLSTDILFDTIEQVKDDLIFKEKIKEGIYLHAPNFSAWNVEYLEN